MSPLTRQPSPVSSITPDVLDRAKGALFGLAVGDALGTILEFSARDTLPHHIEMTSPGYFPPVLKVNNDLQRLHFQMRLILGSLYDSATSKSSGPWF